MFVSYKNVICSLSWSVIPTPSVTLANARAYRNNSSYVHELTFSLLLALPEPWPIEYAGSLMDTTYTKSAEYLFEIGIHAKTPRSGFWNLGSGHQSLAEHTHRTVHAGLVLATLAGDVDVNKVLQMCLFHDLAEGRTGDLNYVHQQYAHADEALVLEHIQQNVPFGDRIKIIHEEYTARVTKESLLAKDADNIELLLSLKEQKDLGNPQVDRWLEGYLERFKTEEGRHLGETILQTNMSDWWYKGKDVKEYWIDRKHHKGHT